VIWTRPPLLCVGIMEVAQKGGRGPQHLCTILNNKLSSLSSQHNIYNISKLYSVKVCFIKLCNVLIPKKLEKLTKNYCLNISVFRSLLVLIFHIFSARVKVWDKNENANHTPLTLQ